MSAAFRKDPPARHGGTRYLVPWLNLPVFPFQPGQDISVFDIIKEEESHGIH